ncbi:MAG: phosphoglucosamine mutase [Thermodesulfobacteriota bacterium]|nr:phosphoglucosamine mutase [Thermodesulfobacteriota bacterium]
MRKLFGTDGIRGVANIEPMTVEMTSKLGRATAHIFKNKKGPHKIVIGKDTRLSGYMLENALTAGICSMGVDVLLVGPLPTPGIAFLTESMRADAGIVISASHNHFQDNGIKIFSHDGFKLPDTLERKIENLIFTEEIDSLRPTATDIGKAFRIDDAIGRYIVFLKNTFPKEYRLDGLKVVLDCANGATYKVAPTVLEELGADVTFIGVKPNGQNINFNCGSLYPDKMVGLVKRNSADIGIALDGDGDRVIFADENGAIIDGDVIMAILAVEMLKTRSLKKNTLVATIMSNMGLDLCLKKFGGKVVKASVGDRYVVEEMVKKDYNFGGEKSGHIVFLDYNTTGDGMITALQVLSVMIKTGKKLSELASIYEELPQVLLNVSVKEKRDLSKIPTVAKAIKEAKNALSDSGRIVVRYSGTEPLARVMVEGKDEKIITELAHEVEKSIECALS